MPSDATKDSWNFDSLIDWIYLNRIKVGVVSGVIVIVAIALAFSNWRKTQNEANANVALFTLPSPLAPAGKTSTARPQDFQKIAADYPETRAGERAELIAAGILFSENKYAEAQMAFAKFLEKHKDSSLQAQAALGVAASLEAQNKTNEAVVKYQEWITKYPNAQTIAPTKLTLARLLDSQNKPAEALRLYEDLRRSNNPYDPWATEARERYEQLLRKFPNLKPKPVLSAPTNTPLAAPPSSLLLTPPVSPLATNSNPSTNK